VAAACAKKAPLALDMARAAATGEATAATAAVMEAAAATEQTVVTSPARELKRAADCGLLLVLRS
jgi:hypothetical protein